MEENNVDYSYLKNDEEYQKEREEAMLLKEYGTTNPKLIEEIKQKRKDNRSLWIFLIGIGLIGWILMGTVSKCTESKFNPIDDDKEWQYRHTDKFT